MFASGGRRHARANSSAAFNLKLMTRRTQGCAGEDETMRQLLMLTTVVAFVSIASSALAEVIDVTDNHGGRVDQYDARWRAVASRDVGVRVIGPCKSACTVLLAHIPRSKICVLRVLWIPPGAQVRDDDAALERVPVGREGGTAACQRREPP
jgi:hypothetical protein